jgi:hypothetical protein
MTCEEALEVLEAFANSRFLAGPASEAVRCAIATLSRPCACGGRELIGEDGVQIERRGSRLYANPNTGTGVQVLGAEEGQWVDVLVFARLPASGGEGGP